MFAFARARRKLEASIAVLLLVFALLVVTSPVTSVWGSSKPPITLAATLTLSGPNAAQAMEERNGLQLSIDAVNRAGGIDGRRITLQIYDDRDDPATAVQVAHQVAASRALFVFGNYYSNVALAPGAVYKQAGLPAITTGVSNNLLTIGNPYYFRLRSTISTQASTIATYVRQILGTGQATIVHASDTAYGVPQATTFAQTFNQAGGHIVRSLSLDTSPATLQEAASRVAAQVKQLPHPGIIFLAMLEAPMRVTVVALRRAGVTAPIITTDIAGSPEFATGFAGYPEEQRDPGYFTANLYTASPLIYDSAPDAAQTFATAYQAAYGTVPGWQGAMEYAAAQVVVAALQSAPIQDTPASVDRDRQAIHDALAAMDSPENGVYTINGLVYFPSNHNSIVPIRFGQYHQRRLISLPMQLAPIENPALVDLAAARRAGNTLRLGGQDYWKQRVVYAGLNINKISQVNVTSGTFSADFYFWLRYSGSDDATNIVFTNATSDVTFDPASSLNAETIDGLHYRLYHVTGDFKASYDYHDYPFDRQNLTISFQNTTLTRDHLTYVIDILGLRLRADDTPDPAVAAAAFGSLASWSYRSMRYTSDTFTSDSTFGKPALFVGLTETAYSGLQVTMTIQRNSRAFLVNHVLPLLLLFLIVYATLHCPPSLLKERLTIPVTALLAGAVLLTAINSALPDIGYAVAAAYAFYIFFLLCLIAIVTAVIDDLLIGLKRVDIALRVDLVVRIIYIIIIIAMIFFYWQDFGTRFI